MLNLLNLSRFGLRARVPRPQAESREVEQVQHLRHVGLAHQRRVGLEQQVVEQHRLAEVEKRSEERRVGKECRSRWSPDHEKKKKEKNEVERICEKNTICTDINEQENNGEKNWTP